MKVTRDQKQHLFEKGYLILKNVVPREQVDAARAAFNEEIGRLRIRAAFGKPSPEVQEAARRTFGASNPVFLELFNQSPAKQIVSSLIEGGIDDATGVQNAFNYPMTPDDSVNETGYRDRDTPFYGWGGHLDGCWSGGGPPPPIGKAMTPAQKKKWWQHTARNTCDLDYPGYNATILNFTALVGIALSDQRRTGVGNLGVLAGAHHAIEQVFREQAEAGGPIGPDGPGWDRLNKHAPTGHGLNHYPDSIREQFRRGAVVTDDGRIWPKPTLLKLAPGDMVIAHFALPHSATRVHGPDPRMMCYYRITPKTRPGESRAPYVPALTDIWHEWRGMKQFRRSRP